MFYVEQTLGPQRDADEERNVFLAEVEKQEDASRKGWYIGSSARNVPDEE